MKLMQFKIREIRVIRGQHIRRLTSHPSLSTVLDLAKWDAAPQLREFVARKAELLAEPAAMRANLNRTGGLVFSQDVLLFLVGKGFSREEAYAIVQGAAMESLEGKRSFRELLSADRSVRAACGAR